MNKKLKDYVNESDVLKKFTDVLGDADQAFIISMLDYCDKDNKLSKSEPNSTVNAFIFSASMGLSFDKSINECYFTAVKSGSRLLTQFNITYRGLIQLAHRTKEYTIINSNDVRDGELAEIDGLTGEIKINRIQDQDQREKTKVIGYVAHFELINGFRKSDFMTVERLEIHGKKYSSNYNEKWDGENFDAMAKKTVLKLLLDKFGFKSSEMKLALKIDQAKINDDGSLEYIDNQKVNISKEEKFEMIIKLFEEVESLIPSSDYNHIKRIIDNKEETSYNKLIATLKNIKTK